MKKLVLLSLMAFLYASPSLAENVILMIGDGMGSNHLKCFEKNGKLFMKTLPFYGQIKTYSANDKTTDSAASATAYSCGIKTNNTYLAMTPDKKPCETIAEKAIKEGYFVGIRSTDVKTGATPSAFYAHNISRNDVTGITQDLETASKQMDISFPDSVEEGTKQILQKAAKQDKPFFIMIEEARIDIESHKNNYNEMQKYLASFDKAVASAVQFAQDSKETTVIVVADHETGGLTNECIYTTNKHTPENVLYFSAGSKGHLLNEPVLENTTLYEKMNQILF